MLHKDLVGKLFQEVAGVLLEEEVRNSSKQNVFQLDCLIETELVNCPQKSNENGTDFSLRHRFIKKKVSQIHLSFLENSQTKTTNTPPFITFRAPTTPLNCSRIVRDTMKKFNLTPKEEKSQINQNNNYNQNNNPNNYNQNNDYNQNSSNNSNFINQKKYNQNNEYQENNHYIVKQRKIENTNYGSPPIEESSSPPISKPSDFSSAKTQFIKENGIEALKPQKNTNNPPPSRSKITKTGSSRKFKTPFLKDEEENPPESKKQTPINSNINNNKKEKERNPLFDDERLIGCEEHMIELILNEIVDKGHPVTWGDVAGLHSAKKTINELIILPMKRPDIFTGIRAPPKGLLLFGPPGTGKTLIGKVIASQSKATFFSISASSLTSKWVGEGEKMVRTMFAIARCHEPSVIFIDEIDSILSKRTDGENDSSRKIKTEFLIQLDGVANGKEERLLVIGATNRPDELDEAARRRLVKKLYIPLPEFESRKQLISNLLEGSDHSLRNEEIEEISKMTEGFSGADLRNLTHEASMVAIREVDDIEDVDLQSFRPISKSDFITALKDVKANVTKKDLTTYEQFNTTFGTRG